MLFNSYIFLAIFLPVVVFIFYYKNKNRLELLIIASSIFYMYWSFHFFILLVISIFANYFFGKIIQKKNSINLCRVFVVINIALLIYFKYLIFILNIFNMNFSMQLILPLGISFYTFTQIAYLIDCYDKKICKSNIFEYALFVLYFPHLIAGPILHHKEMILQFKRLNQINFDEKLFYGGLYLFLIGLMKKIFIADNISIFVDSVFSYSKIDSPGLFSSWAGAIGYTYQLYFDFSGYSDMALGISRMLRIEIPQNFNSPYKATNIIMFWSRWHMSLSKFLKDYLYIRLLGGNVKGKLYKYKNIITTMVLGGIWHGAGFNFILWGLFHGLLITITHIFIDFKIKINFKINNFIKITFNMIIITHLWLLFRVENLSSLKNLLIGMYNFENYTLPTFLCQSNCDERYVGLFTNPNLGGTLYVIVPLILSITLATFFKNSNELYNVYVLNSKFDKKIYHTLVGFLFAIIVLSLNKPSTFLYYQF